VTYRILEEDLVPALRSLSNVFDDVTQDATEMADSDRREARTFLIRDLGAAASIARELQVRRLIRASKTEDRHVISASTNLH
jgi:hypothetical protein